MARMSYADAIDSAIAQAMAEDENIVIWGEDSQLLRVNLTTQFGKGRVLNAPISESAFLGAGVTAAMAGLKPIVDIYMIDFVGVCASSLINEAAKIKDFSGGKWNVPLVVRLGCGGGYGDAGQHQQALWAWLAHVPGMNIVVPSNPADAGGLMLSAIECKDPVIYFEHKLLADYLRDYLGEGGREGLDYDVPSAGEDGDVPDKWEPIPLGKANIMAEGDDLTIISLGVGVHRSLEAAAELKKEGKSVEVIDLRCLVPLDIDYIVSSVKKTGNLIVVDEDYTKFGLSGEISAILLENKVSFKYGRVGVDTTIPYNHEKELQTLPNTQRILKKARNLLN